MTVEKSKRKMRKMSVEKMIHGRMVKKGKR